MLEPRDLVEVKRHWESLAADDPFWAVLTVPDKYGGRWDPAEVYESGRREISDLWEWLLPLGIHPKGRALDFGSGVGRLAQALADRFEEVVGVDISANMVRIAEEHNCHRGRCRFVVHDHPDLRLFEDESFDFICSSITLQHLEPTLQLVYLEEFLRVLRYNGCMVFQLASEPLPVFNRHLPEPVRRLYLRVRRGRLPTMPMYGIPRSQVESFIRTHGGEVVSVRPDTEAGKDWASFRYCVRRESVPSHRSDSSSRLTCGDLTLN